MAKYQNIIKTNENIEIKLIRKSLIHYPLKYTWGIHKTKWYNKVLNVPYLQEKGILCVSSLAIEIPIPKIQM